MSLKYKVESLITAGKGGLDFIGHGCNCFNTMGNGIAPLIKTNFPEAYTADLQTLKGDKGKLGSFTYAFNKQYDLGIFNLYSQYGFWGRNRGLPDIDYDALRNALRSMGYTILKFEESEADILKLGLPKIGAGLAGGDWNIISKIIEEELQDHGIDVTIYVLNENEIPEGGIKL